jgi:hypothetical protein
LPFGSRFIRNHAVDIIKHRPGYRPFFSGVLLGSRARVSFAFTHVFQVALERLDIRLE